MVHLIRWATTAPPSTQARGREVRM
jgi:hypothetical protein